MTETLLTEITCNGYNRTASDSDWR